MRDGGIMKQPSLVIVEDEMPLALALTNFAEELGYQVLATANTELSAVETVLEREPDVVLMDVHLARGNGLSAASAIRKNSKVPIVFCTSWSSDGEIQRAVQQLGNASLIDKLIDEAELVGLLDNVLRASAPSLPLSASEPWPPTMVERIDAYAHAAGVTGREALRQLIELGLKMRPKKSVKATRQKSAQSQQRLLSQSN